MVEVSASFLNVEKENSIQTIYNLEASGIDYFHIDVMDGKFVKNNTVDRMREYTEYMKQIANTKIEVHLMVEEVESYVKSYLDIGVNSITFHIESLKNEMEILKMISYIKKHDTQVGLSINPKTKIEQIYPYLPYIHKVLVMSVEPGAGGQKFLPEARERIQTLNKAIYENGFEIDIEVDGGINAQTALEVIEAGANILVAGSYIVTSENYKEAIKNLRG